MSRNRPSAAVLVGVVVLLAIPVAEGILGLHIASLLHQAGRDDLNDTGGAGGYLIVLGALVGSAVGAVLALDQPRHPVGWLFLALGAVVMMATCVDSYAAYAALADPGGHHPLGGVATLVADREFIPWFMVVTLVLHLTPDGHFLGPRWRVAGLVGFWAGVLALLLSVFTIEPFDPPFQHVRNSFGVAAVQPATDDVKSGFVYVVMLGLVVSAVSLVLRFRRSRGDERRRLLWLMVAVVPMPLFVILSMLGSRTDDTTLTLLSAAGFLTLVPVVAGLSVLRYRLYDVERILASTITWVLLSTILVATYAFVIWLGAGAVPTWSVSPALSATVGAVAAAGLAFPLRRALQDQVDRRFNRRAYDARTVIAAALAQERAGVDVEQLLRDALADPSVTVAYPGLDGGWLRADGSSASPSHHVDVDRHQRVVARVGFDPARNDADAVRRAAGLAAAELDNTRLRAELAQQVVEIAASRERLAGAQRAERRRIERDLHDGAQQSLLALAFELQSAQLNGDPGQMRQALATGAESAQAAVRGLRDLANGLHPAALTDGGLAAALDDMARHSPVPLLLRVDPGRLDPSTEFTAWSVIGEAVTNAQKHAAAAGIDIDVQRQNGDLRLRVHDDGSGGANPDGPGLRGLRDRVEAARGRLTVTTGGDGTTVEAVLPCGS